MVDRDRGNVSLFYKSLSYTENVEFQTRKRYFKRGKPCAVCGRTLATEQMVVAHLTPVRELTDKKALFNEQNWEVRCIDCERKLHREEQLRANASQKHGDDLKLGYLQNKRKRKISAQKAYRNARLAQQEIQMRRLSGRKHRRRRVRRHRRDDYYRDADDE